MDGASSDGHYRRLLERSPAGLLVTTTDGEILEANPASARFLGYQSPEELERTNVRDHYADPDQREEMIEQVREDGTVESVELLMETRNGDRKWLLSSINAQYDEERDRTVLLGTWVDVTRQRMLREELEHLARHDDLTGLLNRRALFERAEQVLAMCDREDRLAAVLYLDIAGFKEVNQQLGHKGGDEILAAVGERLEGTMRDADLLARIGGDEFVIVAPLLRDERNAEQVGRRVIYAFEEPFPSGDIPLSLQPAVGIAVHPEDGADMDTLLHRADQALWGPDRDKPPGARRYHPGDLATDAAPQWEVARELERALQRGDELFQVYQPIVSADDGDMVGLESLVRWEHPERGLLAPGTFIREAEASGLVRQMDRVVFRNTIQQAADWAAEGTSFGWVAVNLSTQSLSDPNWVEWVRHVLEQHPALRPGQVVVEITEHTAMQQVSRTDTLKRLQEDVGISLSIDDFGIGYSSLLYLRRFPADYLKIDLEFVRNVAHSEADQKVVGSIIGLGDAFDMKLIAEGVETEGQEGWLREAGCQYLQGYRFGRPERIDRVEETIQG